jgi:hypothetical protein
MLKENRETNAELNLDPNTDSSLISAEELTVNMSRLSCLALALKIKSNSCPALLMALEVLCRTFLSACMLLYDSGKVIE